ncbi:MAG: NAD-dependent epimerase/dehydratase family protein [Thermoplasmata archaeon]|nr:NAD-dependent epimerase/dehydratase family protein [Thermoplasmata archaeon]
MESNFSSKTVLVTGAAGFVGTHLCSRLSGEGAKVVGADNFSFARPDRASGDNLGYELATIDIRKPDETKALLERTTPDFVFHLAAVANPRTCKQDFPMAFDVNVLGTQNVLRFSPAASRFVFMSSAAVYGAAEYLPIDEQHPRRGSDPYSVTKIIGEDLATSYQRNYARDIVTVRNFNSYGVGQTGDYIVPQLIRQALTEKKIEIWDPRTVRDLMYIDNTIDALLAVATSGQKTVVNIGAGRGITVGELAEAIAGRFGGQIPVVDLKKAVIGSPALVSNNERLRSLSWSERVGFEDGIERTIDWTRRQLAAPA